MNFGIIKTLVAKDASLYLKNRLFAFFTILGILTFIIIYFILPSSVNEELEIGLFAPVIPPVFELIQEEDGLKFEVFESEEALIEAITGGDYVAGVVLPADIMDKFASGLKPRITLYFPSAAPAEITDAVRVMIKELAYIQTGQPLAIEMSTEILGRDRLGAQIPPRDRMRPLFAVFILMFETMGLASLISEEVEHRTAQALLVTPMGITDFFAAKGITGVSLAFGQVVFFMTIVGGMSNQPLIILTALLLGSVLVTGVAFLVASLAKDIMSVMAWSMPVFITLSLPAFGIMFPGTITSWAKAVPSYYLADTVHQAANFGAGWGDIWSNLLILLGFNLVIIWGGIMALKRKFQ